MKNLIRMFKINQDEADFIFRAFFCLIFVGLGAEHIFSDSLIQKLMPDWMPYRRLISFLCGLWLFGWGSLILIGWKVHLSGIALGAFVIVVTLVVHLPGVMLIHTTMPAEWIWVWDILQRTNLVKNICLLGVCIHLLHHKVGKYSLEKWLEEKN